MNGLDALLIALVIAFSFVCWLCFQDFDRWVHYEPDKTGPAEGRRSGTYSPPGAGVSRGEAASFTNGALKAVGGASTSLDRPFDWQESV